MEQDRGLHAAKNAHDKLARSPKWEKTKQDFLKKNPICAACGPQKSKTKALQVHHRDPFHYCVLAGRPDLELDFRNLVTLCETEKGDQEEDHHLLIGHLNDFHSYNPEVWEHATGSYHGRTKTEIEADKGYQKAIQNRPKKWPDMSDKERADFKAYLDKKYPLQPKP